MSLSDNYPDIRPVWMNDYANAGVIDPRCSFARSDSTPSNVHYWSSEDHLSSENLFKYSNDLSTGWLEDNVTFTGGQTAPDGGSDAYTITENSATNEHRFYPNAAIATDGGTTTFSGYFKYIGRQWIVVKLNDGSTDRRVWFDIQNGVVGTTNTGITASITASGGGYYKVVATIATSSTSYFPLVGGASADNVYVYAGSGADAFYVWGLQYNHNVGSVLSETSGQIHREYAATLKSVAHSGQPRFEYEPTGDRSAKGLLIEGQSSNLIGSSEDFSTSWQLLNATKSLEAIAPNGALNAIAFREGTNSLEKRLLRYYGASSGDATISVYAKLLGNARRLVIREANASAQYATFDLVTGTKVSGLGSIESVGNGWFRCQLNLSTNGTLQAAGFYIVPADGNYGNREYAGDGYSGLLLAHPQAENQSWASSYIQTPSGVSSSTRTADSLSVATADIGYTGGPVSVVGEVRFNEATASSVQYLMHLSNGTGDDAIMVSRRNSGGYANKLQGYIESDNVDQGSIYLSSSTVTNNTNYKWAISVDTNDFKADLNGLGNGTSDAGVTLPKSASTLKIGAFLNSGSELDGHIKRVALYSEALTDTELQSLTS